MTLGICYCRGLGGYLAHKKQLGQVRPARSAAEGGAPPWGVWSGRGRQRGGSTLHPTPDSLHPAPCTLHLASYTLHPAFYTLHPTPYIRMPASCRSEGPGAPSWSVWSGRGRLTPEPYTRHPTPCTLHSAPCTLHPISYALHSTPYTRHPTPYTPHPTPYTLHPPWGVWSGRGRQRGGSTLKPTPQTLHR